MMKFDICAILMIGKRKKSEFIFKIDFCIYFRYRACLALQITNLLTRAMFARCLNMNDLPAVSFLYLDYSLFLSLF
jgi:hypothetical protein